MTKIERGYTYNILNYIRSNSNTCWKEKKESLNLKQIITVGLDIIFQKLKNNSILICICMYE